MLHDFKDGPEANNDDDEFSDNDEIKSVEYSLPITQSDELNKYLSMKIDVNALSSDVLTF